MEKYPPSERTEIIMAKYILSAFADEVTSVFEDQLKYLNKQGIGYIELRNLDGTNVSSLTIEQAKEYKAMLDKYGVKVSAIGSPVGKIDIKGDHEEHLALLKHTLDLADIFETKNIRVFSYYYPQGTDRHDYREEVMANLEKLLAEAEKRGINLCHENEARIYGEAPSDCLEVMKQFGGRMKTVLDMGNFAFCGQNPMEGYELLKDYIQYIHIKDAFGDGTIVPAGTGEGQIEAILKLFSDYTDREIILTLEPHLTSFSGLDKLSNPEDIKVQNAFETPELAFDAGTQALRDILARI